MSGLTFNSVFYKNFFSVGNHGITIDLTRSPTTLIGGANGSGKSTLLESICYCLFGKPMKKIVLSGLVNSKNRKAMLVSVDCEREGKSIKIVRGDKPKVLELWIDGELQNQDAKSNDYQKKIENTIGLNFDTFIQMVVLNKERYKPFMEMSSGDRRKVVEEVLDIRVLSYMSQVLKEELKTITIKLDDLKHQRSRIDAEINAQQRIIDEAASNIDERRNDVTEQIKGLDAEIDVINATISHIGSEIDSFNKDELTESQKKASSRKSEFERIAITFQNKIKGLNEKLEFFSNNDNCPTCKQGIDETFKQTVTDEASEEIGKAKANAGLMAVEYKKVVDKNKTLTEDLEKLKDLATNLRTKESEKSRIESQIKRLNDQLATIVANPKVDRFIEEKAALQDKHTKNGEEIDDVLAEEDLLLIVKEYLKDEGIKANIVRDYIGFINLRVNEYLNDMNLFLNITLNENFEEKINSISRENFTIDNLSTGQKCRVNLAVWMTLLEVSSLKNSVVTNLMCLDEILEPMDVSGVQDFMKLVKEKFSHKNIFVITQRFDEFSEHFRSSIYFTLNEDFTEIKK